MATCPPRGPAGPKGEKGDQGPRGLTGQEGGRGERGYPGPKGDRGPAGEKGKDGEQGPKGDRGDRGERGEKGEQGPQGLQGIPGERGTTGPAGQPGPRGFMGPAGPRGLRGSPGARGARGSRGANGARGATGPAGPRGATGPAGPRGRDGRDGKNGKDGKSPTINQILVNLAPTLNVNISAQVNAWLQANISVLIAQIQANLLVQLQATVNAWLQANIAVFVGILQANVLVQLQATVNAWLQANIAVFVGILQANVLVQLQATVNAWLQANIAVFVGILQANLFVQLQNSVNVWLQANIGVFVGIIRAQIEANLFVQLQNSVNVWLQNNIGVLVNLIYARLETNLYLRLEPNLRVYIDSNPRFRGPEGPRGLPGSSGERGLRGPQGIPGKDGIGDLTFLPRLIWNSNTNRLELRLTINGVTRNSPVTLDMDCDFTELIQYLTDIQEKVTVDSPIRSGQCTSPQDEGDWYQYQQGTITNSGSLEGALTLLSKQIEEIHQTACQGVLPKVPTRDLPPVIQCVTDDEGNKQIQEMSYADMQAGLGFIPPWLFGAARDVVAPWAVDRALDWLGNQLKEQEKINQQILCKLEPCQDVTVLLPDPSAVHDTKGNYLLFFWYIEGEKWAHRSQLAEPIDEIVNPPDPEEVWETYFANLTITLGNQWAQILTADRRRRFPLYKGWFYDKNEAQTKLFQMAALSKLPIRQTNNPTFREVLNETTRITNVGKTMRLRKVCVGIKSEDSDRVIITQAYEPPKTP